MVTFVQAVSAFNIMISSYSLNLFFRTDHHNIPKWIRKVLSWKRFSKIQNEISDRNEEEQVTWKDFSRACDKVALGVISVVLILPSLTFLVILVTWHEPSPLDLPFSKIIANFTYLLRIMWLSDVQNNYDSTLGCTNGSFENKKALWNLF